MTFVHAIPLALLALPLIPLLLHLLSLQRRTVELPTYRFLFDSYVQQRRRARFLEALLVILRMLFILGAIAIVARPMSRDVANSLFPAGSGRDVIVLLDCSRSMNATADGRSSFDRAKEFAAKVVDKLANDDRVTLVRAAGKPEIVLRRFTTESASIKDSLKNLQLSPARANLFAALARIFGEARNDFCCGLMINDELMDVAAQSTLIDISIVRHIRGTGA